jgi:Flp pilus assembly protein TadD
LDEIRLRQSEDKVGGFDRRAAVPRYAAAFASSGLDVRQGEPAVLGERLRGHAQRERLLAALRDWARLTADEGERERLAAVLSAVEPEPDAFGRRLREALAQPGTAALVRLAKDADVSRLPAATLVQLARDLRHGGEAEAALALLLRVQERHPSDFWLNHELGWALEAQKPARPEEAARYFTAAVVLRPSSPNVLMNLGVALYRKGDRDGAITWFKKALDLDPNLAPAHSNLGSALHDKGDVEGAIRAYRRALELDPKLAGAHNNLGAIFGDSKRDYDRAIACFRRAIALDPKDARFHSNLGNALRGKGELGAAIHSYRRAIELNPKIANAHGSLGNALFVQGKREEATSWRGRSALSAGPSNSTPRSPGPMAHLARHCYSKDDLPRPATALAAAWTCCPNSIPRGFSVCSNCGSVNTGSNWSRS